MRDITKVPWIENHRVTTGQYASTSAIGNNGKFIIPRGPDRFCVICSNGRGWEHVSVSLTGRCPSWLEMQWIRGLFFNEEEWVIQFSPPKSEAVNYHPYCLHLWRPTDVEFPTPPSIFVGPKDGVANEQKDA